jgi:predicted ATPase
MTLRRGASSFVGRAEQLDRLEQALRSAQQGAFTTVLVGGEAGIGKTRLITEFTTRARDQNALVLSGAG